MKKSITKSLVERAKPEAKPYRIHDTTLPGFTLRVQPTGRKIWVLLYKRKTRTLGHYPQMTVAMAREAAMRVLNGEDSQQQPPEVLTLSKFIEKYYKDFAESHHSRPKETLSHLLRFGLEKRELDQIKLADVEKWRNARLQENMKSTRVNRIVADLHAALQKAYDWELIQDHPLARLKPLKIDSKGVVRYLSPAEEERLSDALLTADPWVKAFTIVALNTGCRRGELWKLTWADIDLKKKLLTIHGKGAKSGQTRHIPLNSTAIANLKAWRGDAVPMKKLQVFGEREFKKSWATLLKRANIENFRFHDTRHHFASKLVMAGVPLNTVRELLGHTDLKMTLRYSHLAPDNLRGAVELIG